MTLEDKATQGDSTPQGNFSIYLRMDMCGCVWICVDMCGYVWICVDRCGYLWICVDMCGWMWMDVDGCGYLWMDVDICGWTPVVWPGYAPVWGLGRDLLEKRPFFAQIMFF